MRPRYVFPSGNSVTYGVNWDSQTIAQVLTKEEVDNFMKGLKEVIDPELPEINKTHCWVIWPLMLLCFLFLGIIGSCIYICIKENKINSMGKNLHQKVVAYCHENRAPFFAKGIRPRPGICGTYVVFEANFAKQ